MAVIKPKMIPGALAAASGISRSFFKESVVDPKATVDSCDKGLDKVSFVTSEIIHNLRKVRHVHHHRHKGRNPTKNFHLFFIHFETTISFSFFKYALFYLLSFTNSSPFYKCYRTVKCHNLVILQEDGFLFERVFSLVAIFLTHCLILCECNHFHLA